LAGIGVPTVHWRDGVAHGHVQEVVYLLYLREEGRIGKELLGLRIAQEVN
jgi:hypothetical protein